MIFLGDCMTTAMASSHHRILMNSWTNSFGSKYHNASSKAYGCRMMMQWPAQRSLLKIQHYLRRSRDFCRLLGLLHLLLGLVQVLQNRSRETNTITFIEESTLSHNNAQMVEHFLYFTSSRSRRRGDRNETVKARILYQIIRRCCSNSNLPAAPFFHNLFGGTGILCRLK
jgi:hypothetical protein